MRQGAVKGGPDGDDKTTAHNVRSSHFCEKARWGLDWHGISYEEVGWPPGLHQILTKRRGLKEAKVPIVFDGDEVVESLLTLTKVKGTPELIVVNELLVRGNLPTATREILHRLEL